MPKSYKIKTTGQFSKSFQKLPKSIREKAKVKYKLFRKDIYHPALRTHKLKGDHNDCYSFSVNYSYRIVFTIEDNYIILLDIGTHAIYK